MANEQILGAASRGHLTAEKKSRKYQMIQRSIVESKTLLPKKGNIPIFHDPEKKKSYTPWN